MRAPLALAVALVACGDGGAPSPEPRLCDDCLPCARGDMCAPEEPHLEGSCCVAGDPLVPLATAQVAELSHVEVRAGLMVVCGGQGAEIFDVSGGQLDPVAEVSGSCQRAAIGDEIGGSRLIYLADDGSSTESGTLRTAELRANGSVEVVDEIAEDSIRYGGLALDPRGYLVVAAFENGARLYQLDEAGQPGFDIALPGSTDARRAVVVDEIVFVVDRGRMVFAVDLSNVASPQLIDSATTSGVPRDAVFSAGSLVVASGGEGVDVFELANEELTLTRTFSTFGSAEAVAVSDSIVAVAEWSHIAVYDRGTGEMLGLERNRTDAEQNTSLAMVDDTIFAGEWRGVHALSYRQGHVAPTLWVDSTEYTFPSSTQDAHSVVVRNPGHVDLLISEISVSDPEDYRVTDESLFVPPGAAASFEVQSTPDEGEIGDATLQLTSNDLDFDAGESTLALIAGQTRLEAGDRLTSDFSFLDPTGSNDLLELEGRVLLLAYFRFS